MTVSTETKTAKLMESATTLAHASQGWGYEWSETALDWWKDANADAFERAIRHIGREPPPGLDWEKAANGLVRIFNLDADGHSLGMKQVYLGFDPSETQFNKALGHFLSDGTSNMVRHRLRSFLAALYEYSAQKEEILSTFDAAATFEVDSERRTNKQSNDRRMDLVIGCPSLEPRQCEHIVVVEIKFKHTVTSGQLPAYRKFAMGLVDGDSERVGLFLVTPDGARSPQNKDWVGISWLRLLRNWEQLLASGSDQDTDHDFIRLRRMLWQRFQ